MIAYMQEGYWTARRCDCTDMDRAEKIWKASGISMKDEPKKLNGYLAETPKQKELKQAAVSYVQNFDDIAKTTKNWLVVLGQNGSGKTHISLAIAAALMNREKNKVPVIYMPYLEAMRELKASTNDNEYYLKTIQRYNRARLLIIDDLFKDKVKNGQLIEFNGTINGLNEADLKHIMPILNYRYLNKLPTIISSECLPDQLIMLDEAIAGRILEDEKNHATVIIHGREYNYRLKNFRQKEERSVQMELDTNKV